MKLFLNLLASFMQATACLLLKPIQRLQLQRVVEYGKNRNITVKITEIE